MLWKKCIPYFVIVVTGIFLFGFVCVVHAEENAQVMIMQTSGTDSAKEKIDSDDESYKVFSDLIAPISLEFLGAFLGVLTALGLNAHASKKQYKELNESLYNELLTLETDLNKRFNEKQDYYRYLTPIWDINLASGNLSVLVNKHIDKKYIEIYSKIQYAQELEREYIHSKVLEMNSDNRFLIDYIITIDSARIREAKEICELISKIKKDVK